ncbi:hypothetical protein LEP1GSC061_4233 [Leptospira wolffii serovar Khorat str. Khorat-H2]|nr:hypothetical protein LEP1GSC061_4233 [Leptospira wolffii serovar Khorat str. Khorat-H2]
MFKKKAKLTLGDFYIPNGDGLIFYHRRIKKFMFAQKILSLCLKL